MPDTDVRHMDILWAGNRLEIAILCSIVVVLLICLCCYLYARHRPEILEAYWRHDRRVIISFLLGAFTIIFTMCIISVATLLLS